METVHLVVTDLTGKQKYTAAGKSSDAFTFGDEFSAGIYLLTVYQGGNKTTIKVMKGK